MNIKTQVETKILEYEKQDTEGLLSYISDIIDSKGSRWERSVESEKCELTKMLIYEYVTSLEKLSGGRLSSKFLVDKLASRLHTLRYGSFRKGQDDEIMYGNRSVTSEEYNKKRPGAHTISVNEDNVVQDAVVLFDGRQIGFDGRRLNGIDFTDLDDIRHTIFHEWTHVMEKSLIPREKLSSDEIIHRDGDSIYINSSASADFDSLDYYFKYIEEAEQNSEKPVLFGGVSTIEINPQKSSRRIMHNQISEGFTEYIARLVMDKVGVKTRDTGRYATQVEFADKVFKNRGIESTVTDYLTSSNIIISELEKGKIHGTDLLHYYQHIESLLSSVDRTAVRFFGKEADLLRNQVQKFWENPPTHEEADGFVNKIIEEICAKDESFSEQDKNMTHDMFYNAIYFPSIKKEYIDEIESHYKDKKMSINLITRNALQNDSEHRVGKNMVESVEAQENENIAGTKEKDGGKDK